MLDPYPYDAGHSSKAKTTLSPCHPSQKWRGRLDLLCPQSGASSGRRICVQLPWRNRWRGLLLPPTNLRHTISADGHDQATGRVPPRPQVTLHLWAKVEQETIRRRNARRSQATTRFLCWDKATKSIPTAEKIGMRQHHLEMIHKLCKLI